MAKSRPAGDILPFAALSAMAMTGFAVVMTETLPAGLLPSIAADLHVSPALAGQSITAQAAGSLVAAIPLTAVTQGIERRTVLLAGIVGLVVFNTVTALASSFAIMLIARFMTGIAAGLTWGMLAGFARRLTSDRLAGRALAIALIGVPIALSVGMPAGTLLGGQVGWRGAFLAMSAVMVVLIGGVLAFIPRTSGQAADRQVGFVDVLRRPGITAIMLTVITWMIGHNILYTYIAPFAALSGMESRVDLLLLVFGIAALGGIWYTGARIDRTLRRLVLISIALFIGAAAAMALMPRISWIVALAIVVWGFSFGGSATQLQTAASDAAGDGVDLANAINVTVWNIAIAAGGLVGGVLLQANGAATLPMAAVLFAGAALIITMCGRAHSFPPGPRAVRRT